MKKLAWAFILAGVLIVCFSGKIVFPGLELLLGIETIVGKRNVVYLDDGYAFTNPGAMAKWILTVAGCGVCIAAIGVFILIRAKYQKPKDNAQENES